MQRIRFTADSPEHPITTERLLNIVMNISSLPNRRS
eukprot:SAG31_NODE_4168_length_3512_cov_1.611192_2_plen_36_part_00